MDGHKDAIAVAYVAQDHGAAMMSLGALGTRQGAIDQRIRKMQAKARHLICVYAAAPVAPGSPAIGPKQATPAGWWHRL
jgi:hypothetical protein